MKALLLILPALAGTVAGCAESTSSSAMGEGTFVLRSVAGDPLPARIRVDQFGGEYVSDTLRFEPISFADFAGPAIERRIMERPPGGGSEFLRVEFITYQRDRDAFTFQYPCPSGPAQDCLVGLAGGTLTGDRLDVTVHPNSGLRSPLIYQRIQ